MDIAAERAYPTPFANSTLLPLLLLSLARQKNSPTTSTTIKTEYDYVIVGAGSAGSVVAGRLSELPCVSVLLLEAGKPPPLLNDIPVIGRNFWFTDLDWAYRTAPQKNTGRGLVNRQLVWPSGKAIGGSSILNAMLFVRGNKNNYDDWAAQGAEGWSYKDVLPYFLKMEDNQDPEYLANGFHATSGPETVERPRYEGEIRSPVFEAADTLGYSVVDSNGRRQTGFYDHQATLRDGQRCSTAKAYLVPAENRTNLDILPNAFVRKVAIERRRATGVVFDFQGQTYIVKARKEVIMSAGAINSAQLLMLSGIGPRKHLQDMNIPVIADLPVGENLQDHCAAVANYELDRRTSTFFEKLVDPRNLAKYILNRTGVLSSTEGVTAMAFLNGLNVSPKVDVPNYELYFAEAGTENLQQVFGLKPEVYQQVYAPYENEPFYVCLASLLQPKSRGTVKLQSTNPYDPPLIDPNYFADPRDLEDVVQGLKTCQKIATSEPLRKVGSRPFRTLYPGCEQYAEDEDLYFECQARSVIITLSHQSGTAKMGDPRDPTTVVDPQLRVKSIKGLRVVDASIMPIVPSGNTNVPTIMVAEKASDIIKETIKCIPYPTPKYNPYFYEGEEELEHGKEYPSTPCYEHSNFVDHPSNEFQQSPWAETESQSSKDLNDFEQPDEVTKTEDFSTGPWVDGPKNYLSKDLNDFEQPDEVTKTEDFSTGPWVDKPKNYLSKDLNDFEQPDEVTKTEDFSTGPWVDKPKNYLSKETYGQKKIPETETYKQSKTYVDTVGEFPRFSSKKYPFPYNQWKL